MTLPISESNQPIQAGPAIPAIEDDGTPVAGAALPVVLVSDVAVRGQASGEPLRVSFVTDRAVVAGAALPIVMVGTTGVLIDAFGTQPQKGTRTIAGSSWTLDDHALRGGRQLSSPTWGNSRVVYTDADNQPFTWQAGRMVAALITPSDFADPLFFGLSSSATPTDPTADTGYHWILDTGKLKVRAKDQTITYEPGQSNIRTATYLAVWLLLDTGAALFLQTVTDDVGGGMDDPIGMFAAPDARLVGVWERGTLATFYPVVSALGTGNPDYPGGHMLQQVRVVDVPELVETLATFEDRFDRADTASAIGNGWNAIGCTAGIVSGAAYISAGSGFQFVMHANSLADCRIVFDLSFPNFPTIPLVGVIVRGDSVSNFQNGIRIHTNGGNNLFVQAVQNRGFLDTLYSGPVTWQASNRVEIVLHGNLFKVFVNGDDVTFGMWRTNNYYVNQTHIGLYSQADPNTARWDNIQVYPHSVALPETVQDFSGPTVFEPGTTLLSGFAGFTIVSGTWTDNSGVLSQTIASGEAWQRQALAPGNIEIEVDLILPSGDPVALAGVGVGTFSGTTLTSGLIARIYRDPPSQPTNHEIELLQFTNGSGVIIRKTPLGVFFAASTTYSLAMQIGVDTHRANSEILYVLLNSKVWLSFPVSSGIARGHIILYANSLDTDTRFANLVVHSLT